MTPETPLLQKIYDELLHKKKISNSKDMADRLKFGESYISRLRKSNETLPKNVTNKIIRVFGVSAEWLASGGKEGDMFSDMAYTEQVTGNRNSHLQNKNDKKNPLTNKKELENDISLHELKLTQNMTIERVLGIAEKLATATERDSVTKESLAHTITRLMDHLEGGARQVPNRKVS